MIWFGMVGFVIGALFGIFLSYITFIRKDD